jgi:hypothetical protein
MSRKNRSLKGKIGTSMKGKVFHCDPSGPPAKIEKPKPEIIKTLAERKKRKRRVINPRFYQKKKNELQELLDALLDTQPQRESYGYKSQTSSWYSPAGRDQYYKMYAQWAKQRFDLETKLENL